MDFGTKCLVPPGRARLEPTETRTGPEFFKHLSYPSRSSTEFFRRPTATARRGQGLHVRGAEEMRAVAIGRVGRLAFPMRSGSPGWPKAKRHLLLLKNFDLWQSRQAPTGADCHNSTFLSSPPCRGECADCFSGFSRARGGFSARAIATTRISSAPRYPSPDARAPSCSDPLVRYLSQAGRDPSSPLPSGGSDELPASRRRTPFV